MVLNIFVVVFIAGITFLNTIFGLYSGLINVFCCVMSACIALGFSEALMNALTAQFDLSPSYAGPVCLVGLYIISLTGLRLAADNLIRGNVRIPQYVDWGGGGVCGFVIAQISVGMLVLGFLMLPHGEGRVMLYSRDVRTDDLDPNTQRYVFEERNVWLSPDRFTVGMFNLLSNGSLKGKTAFASVYPDFSQWVTWTNNTVQQESNTAPATNKSGKAFKDGLSVEQWWEETGSVAAEYRKDKPTRLSPRARYDTHDYEPQSGMKLIGVRLALKRASADKIKDRADNHRFRPTMFRVVGKTASGPKQYTPCILGNADSKLGAGARRIVEPDNDFTLSAAGETVIDALFEVDDDFTPTFVEYRRYARARMPAGESDDAASTDDLTMADAEGGAGGGGPTGQMGFVGALVEPSGDRDMLPFAMVKEAVTRGGGSDLQMQGGALVSGRITGSRDDFKVTSAKKSILNKFKVPEGHRLCQVRFNPRKTRSLAGQVFNFVGSTVNQYRAVDSEGQQYPLAGYYGMVKRGGAQYIELFYTGTATPEDTGFRGMLDFKQIKGQELRSQHDAEVGLLFLVPSGKTIVRVENQTGQGYDGLELKMR